jgi:hypothetical protein
VALGAGLGLGIGVGRPEGWISALATVFPANASGGDADPAADPDAGAEVRADR